MTPGVWAMLDTPSAAMVRNHRTVTGPNNAPTRPVPWRWMANNRIRIVAVMGTTRDSNWGVATLIPSTAERTEMAGVMMASP